MLQVGYGFLRCVAFVKKLNEGMDHVSLRPLKAKETYSQLKTAWSQQPFIRLVAMIPVLARQNVVKKHVDGWLIKHDVNSCHTHLLEVNLSDSCRKTGAGC